MADRSPSGRKDDCGHRHKGFDFYKIDYFERADGNECDSWRRKVLRMKKDEEGREEMKDEEKKEEQRKGED